MSGKTIKHADFLMLLHKLRSNSPCKCTSLKISGQVVCQGAFHVVNPADLRREIELLLGVAAYSLLPWCGGATVFCFIRRNCWRDGVIYN